MIVSIIIPTFNRSKTLDLALKSVMNLDFSKKDYEVIVVDDGSTDNTSDIVKKYNVRYFFQKNKGPAAARNLGIKKAKGRIVFFTDDDCIVPKNWIKTFIKYYDNPKIYGVAGPLVLHPELRNNYIASYLSEGDELIIKKKNKPEILEYDSPIAGGTCNISYRKTALESVNGFDESFKVASAEDTDLKKRIQDKNMKIMYDPLPVLHYHRSTFRQLVKLKISRGIGYYLFCKKYNKRIAARVFINALIILPVINIIPFLINLVLCIKEVKHNLRYLPLELLSSYLSTYGVIKSALVNR